MKIASIKAKTILTSKRSETIAVELTTEQGAFTSSVPSGVSTGRFEAGALKESTFRALVAKGQPLRAITSFKNVTKPWIARSGLPEPVHKALRQALLDLKDPAILRTLNKDGFLPADDADFEVIRYAIEENAEFFK